MRSNRPLQLLPLLRTSPPQQSDQSGRNRRATSSPDVCPKLLALAGYCALHACADAPMDARGRTTDCAVGPPAAVPISAFHGRAGPAVAVVCALPTQAVRAHARRPIVCTSCGTSRSIDSIAASTRLLSAARRLESADTRINTSIEPLPQPAAPPLPAPLTSAFLWYWYRRPLHGPRRFRGVPVLIEHDTPDGRGRSCRHR